MGRRTTAQWSAISDQKERRKAQNRLAQRKRRQRNAQNQPQPLSASPELDSALEMEQHDRDAEQHLAVEPHQSVAKPAPPFFDFTQGALLDSFSFAAQAYSASATDPSLHSLPLASEQVQSGAPWLQALDSHAASASSFASPQHSPTDTASFHQPSAASSLSAQQQQQQQQQATTNPLADALRRAQAPASHHRHSSASSASSLAAPAASCPEAPFDARLQFVLAAARSAGFDSLDALMLQYYTRPLDRRSTALLEARRRSRRRDLRQVLARLADDVAGWSQWEAQGFDDALMASAERVVRNEAGAFALRVGSGAGTGGQGAAEGEAGAAHGATHDRVAELRDELPNTWSMLYETARSFLGADREASDFVRAAVSVLTRADELAAPQPYAM